MKWFSIILFFLLQASLISSKWLLMWEYEMNKGYIASTLCENRQLPVLNCQGKCQLRKKMVAEENESTPAKGAKPAKASALEVLFTQDLQTTDLAIQDQQPQSFSSFFQTRKYISPNQEIFHPPLV